MKRHFFILSVSLVIIIFTACSKSSVNGNISPTYLQMINTCYGQSFDLNVGEKNLFSNIGYDSVSLFAFGTPGFYSMTVTNSSGKNILTGNINLQSGLHYSLFLVSDSAQGSGSVRYSLISNTWNAPLYDSAKIQFLNYAYNLPPISFILAARQGNTDTIGKYGAIFQSRTYMDINSTPALAQFQTIPTKLYDVIFYADTGVSYISQIFYDTVVSFTNGAFYTIYMEGNAASRNADSMKVRIVQLKQ